MKCVNCGAELSEGVKFCSYCGSRQDLQDNIIRTPDVNALGQEAPQRVSSDAEQREEMLLASKEEYTPIIVKKASPPVQRQGEPAAYGRSPRGRGIKCPECACKELQSVSMTDTTVQTTGRGYSGSMGCLGFLLFGPCGLLCGNCGNSQNTTTNTTTKLFWVCSNCGHRFRNLEDFRNDIQRAREQVAQGPQMIIMAVVLYAVIYGLMYAVGVLKAVSWFITFMAIMCGICILLGIILIPVSKARLRRLEYEYAVLEAATKD